MNNNELFCLKTINAIKCSLCHKEDSTEVFFPSLISITKEDINNTNLNEFLLKFKKPSFSACSSCSYDSSKSIKSQLIYSQCRSVFINDIIIPKILIFSLELNDENEDDIMQHTNLIKLKNSYINLFREK